MKTQSILLLSCIALISGACAKAPQKITNETDKIAFDAWVETNRTDSWRQTALGSWIIDETPGTGEALGETTDELSYLCMSFTISDLAGTVKSYSEASTAKQLKEYVAYNYYGPQVSLRSTSDMYAGISEVIDGMNVGGHVRFAVPGWLLTSKRYADAQTYLDKVSGTAAIYDVTVTEKFDDILLWEKQRIEKVFDVSEAVALEAEGEDPLDGFYYFRERETDEPDTEFDSSSEVYVNYICRRIDGTAVDTNIKDTAKVYGFYSAGRSYEPLQINWGDKYTDLTMTSSRSKMISGFAYAIFHMKPNEKGRACFVSDYGYQASGSGKAIPPYCPLIFDIEMTAKTE